MTRQNIRPNPAEKLFEAYMDFSGGLNSEVSNERLKDNEFPVIENVDLASRGSAKTRAGRVEILPSYPYATNGTVKGQGLFFYYRQGVESPDMISAVGGKLYVKEFNTEVLKPIKIIDTANGNVEFTFQSTKMIDAVQYRGDLFLATGSRLCELTYVDAPFWVASTDYALNVTVKAGGNVYKCSKAGKSGTTAPTHTSGKVADGTTEWEYLYNEWNAKVVVPYQPTNMEAIYIGTNGLADNPSAYVSDGISTKLEVAGIQPDKRKGNINQPTLFKGFVNKPNTITSVDYLWEYKKSGTTTWVQGQDWKKGADGGDKWSFVPTETAPYDIRLTVRDTATPATTANMILSAYEIYQTEPKLINSPLPTDMLSRCRRIVLHWDRLLLATDDLNPYQMYISDLTNPRYFPTSNTINFDTGKQEPITAIIKYRGMLVVFTKSTIQTLTGKDVSTYSRNLVHDNIGCIAGHSAKVVGNNIIFLSHEGIMMIKPNQLVLEAMNINRIDFPIKSEIPQDSNASAIVNDGQYFLCFPDKKKIYRLYYDNGMWVRDKSEKLDIVQFLQYGETVFNLTSSGRIYQHDKNVFTDCGEQYTIVVESKSLDLAASFNYKKLKRLYVLARHYTTYNIDLYVTIHADAAIVLTPESGTATVNEETGEVVWVQTTESNMHFETGTTFGSWILGKSAFGEVDVSVQKAQVRGKARRFKVIFTHKSDQPCEVFGFGLEFKLKKP